MLEDFEEGHRLSHPSKLNNSNFIPDYSFSSNANLLNVTEATEMLEHAPQTSKESYNESRHSLVNDSYLQLVKKWVTKKKNAIPEGTPRKIYLNKQELNDQQNFMSNYVSTAKYNLFTFLPKFLYVEFSKSANIFFLFISGIQVHMR